VLQKKKKERKKETEKEMGSDIPLEDLADAPLTKW
jgi:hypothetical protein